MTIEKLPSRPPAAEGATGPREIDPRSRLAIGQLGQPAVPAPDGITGPVPLAQLKRPGEPAARVAPPAPANVAPSAPRVGSPGEGPQRGGESPDPARDYSGYWWVGTHEANGPLFKGGIEPKDVHQGGLGTCYLLGDLAAMAAADPEFIRRMVRQDERGNYVVTFHHEGASAGANSGGNGLVPVEVSVDRDLVWGLGRGGLGFQNAKPRGNDGAELWVAIIEKAYAQLHGGYEAVDGGWMGPTFEELTGQRFATYYEPSADEAWDLLASRAALPAEQRTLPWETRLATPAASSTDAGHGDQKVTLWSLLKAAWGQLLIWLGIAHGYATNHAYGILGIGQDADRGRYVIMYNPWGNYEGVHDGPNDGLFRIPLSEFERAYEDLVVAR